MKLATKLTWMMFIVLLLVGSSIGFFGYRTAYKQVDEAAGIELVGCANITTGLIDPSDITALIAGDQSKLRLSKTGSVGLWHIRLFLKRRSFYR